MIFKNPNAERTIYPNTLKYILNKDNAHITKKWLTPWYLFNSDNTPLYSMKNTAHALGIAKVWVKDESERSELGSFKVLGAPYALLQLILKKFPTLNAENLLNGCYHEQLAHFTVISATDGNHGRALAAAAQSIGCACKIVLHAKVSKEREKAIAKYNATIIRITGNYDESVREADRLAKNNGWTTVSDTSYDGYETIPKDVMQGYGLIAAETIEQLETEQQTPTHIIIQGGVGSLAAGVFSYYWAHYNAARPLFIVVEPSQADCLFQSARQSKPSSATGTVDSIMAGLACGETSVLAWSFLQPSVDFFTLIEDHDAIESIRTLAQGAYGDIPLVAGESSVAGFALLTKLAKQHQLDALKIDKHSKVLMINTEGATAPKSFTKLTGLNANDIKTSQKAYK